MTFRGLHQHSLDSKDRITVPAQYRSALAEGVVLKRGVERCVEVWPAGAAEESERKQLARLDSMSRDARRLQRRLFAHSESVELDSAGRVRLSRSLLGYAGLEGSCEIVGMGECLEIWAPDAWSDEETETEERAPELTETLAAAAQATPGGAQ